MSSRLVFTSRFVLNLVLTVLNYVPHNNFNPSKGLGQRMCEIEPSWRTFLVFIYFFEKNERKKENENRTNQKTKVRAGVVRFWSSLSFSSIGCE